MIVASYENTVRVFQPPLILRGALSMGGVTCLGTAALFGARWAAYPAWTTAMAAAGCIWIGLIGLNTSRVKLRISADEIEFKTLFRRIRIEPEAVLGAVQRRSGWLVKTSRVWHRVSGLPGLDSSMAAWLRQAGLRPDEERSAPGHTVYMRTPHGVIRPGDLFRAVKRS